MIKELILIGVMFVSIKFDFISSSSATEDENSLRQPRLLLGMPCKYITHTGKCIDNKRIDTNQQNLRDSDNSITQFRPFEKPKEIAQKPMGYLLLEGLFELFGIKRNNSLAA